MTLTLHVVREPDDERLAQARIEDGDVHASASHLVAGQMRGVVLESAADGPPREIRVAEIAALFDETVRFWQSWLARSTYTGRWREAVQRSAITLKLMTYAPTGGLVAAPTAALPEQIGGERNWDYRYTWVRDASFSVHALLRLGLVDEAARFGGWLGDRVRERVGSDSGPLNIMYRIDGSSDLKEDVLDHWRGYRGWPVRIGNGAAEQLQLDIYGEALDSIYAAVRGQLCRTGLDGHQPRARLARRELGPARGGHLGDPRRPAGLHLRPGDVLGRLRPRHPAGRRARPARRRSSAGPPSGTGSTSRSWTQGWHAARQAFVQHYDTDVLDASLLRMPTVGFIAPTDPMWTVDAGGDGRRAGHRQPGLPLRPGRLAGRPARARRARSRCARSPTSTRSPAPAGSTRPGWRSRRCSPTPTTSGCTPRRSP